MAAKAVFTQSESTEELQLDPNVCAKFGITCLKPAQQEGLKELLLGHDVLAILPTGYGKSLIYHMFPHFLKDSAPVVLIVSPLVSLMKDQISTLSSLGFRAGMINDILESDDVAVPTYVFGSPEAYLQSKNNVPETLKTKYGERIALLVVDEVHTIPKWGDKPNLGNRDRRKVQEGAFREYFSNVGELRSFYPNVRVVALTATASRQLQTQIKESLIIQDCKVLNICPNKENIRYSVLKINDDVAYNLYWMVDKLKVEMDSFPRTIFYCPSIDMASKLYSFFRLECPGLTQNIGMYHSETDQAVQESHLNELSKETGSPLRILFCTTALGMGIDIKGAHHVVHYGLAFDIESYIQESGRVGRDDLPSYAILFYSGRMLRDACPKLRNYIVNSSVCRRVKLFEDFASTDDISLIKNKSSHHSCCDICEKKCKCGQCASETNYVEKFLTHYLTDTESESENSERGNSESDASIDSSSSDSNK